MSEKLKDILSRFGEVDTDVPMSRLTTLHIGGNASYVVRPLSMVELDGLVKYLVHEGIPFKVFGKGSNLLCSDSEFHGVIISLEKGFCRHYFEEDMLVAEAGCSIIALAYDAMRNSLSGLEFASGIPGTVGGSIYMNAGAYKSSVSEVIDSVLVYRDGKFEWITAEECDFAYRTSIFQRHPLWVIIAARFHMVKEDQDMIRSLMDNRRERRMNTQPLDMPSAGSVFRNPMDMPAWKLIEGIGYRGRSIGDIAVSEKHVNFIVNKGNGTASDFIALTNEIQQKVKEKYDIDLHMEVEKFNWQ